MNVADGFVVLFDYDSMLYKAVYKVASSVDPADTPDPVYPNSFKIRKWFKDGRSREWMEEEIINLSINRLSNMSDGILLEIEETGIEISGVEYFLTYCKNSVRKKASPIYKIKRKKNKWVSMVRTRLIEMDSLFWNDEWEADDLIKDRAIHYGVDKCLICSIDKDMKQIEGVHFDYYRPILKNPDGSRQLDENGFRKVAPCRGLEVVTEKQANDFFWKQMLMGDSGDGIKGIPKIGKVKASKIIEESFDHERTVLAAYMNYFGNDEGRNQFDLHRLLLGLGIEHRP